MERIGDFTRFPFYVNRVVLAGEAQCAGCGYFDIDHPGLRDRLVAADPDGRRKLLVMAACRCAVTERQAKAARDRLVAMANLPRGPVERTVQSFQSRPGTEKMRAAVQEFLAAPRPRRGLTISGPTGSGKTHMLEAIGRRWLEGQRTVRYEVAAALVDRLRRESLEGSMDMWDWWNWYESRDLLLLDDLGMERSTPYAAEHLSRLVDDRLTSGLPLVVATNLTRDDMAEHMGDRIASRLYVERDDVEGLRLVTTSAADYRKEGRHGD